MCQSPTRGFLFRLVGWVEVSGSWGRRRRIMQGGNFERASAGLGTGNTRVCQGVEIARSHVPVHDPEIVLGSLGALQSRSA